MSYLYGTQARVYGISGNVKEGTPTEWASLSSPDTVCIISGYTFTPSTAGAVEGFDQNGNLTSEAFAYATFELQVNFEFGGDTSAHAKGLILPVLMAKIQLENMDNVELNGIYNFRSGSITGANQGWKTGSMTLRAISGADLVAANKVAFASV